MSTIACDSFQSLLGVKGGTVLDDVLDELDITDPPTTGLLQLPVIFKIFTQYDLLRRGYIIIIIIIIINS